MLRITHLRKGIGVILLAPVSRLLWNCTLFPIGYP